MMSKGENLDAQDLEVMSTLPGGSELLKTLLLRTSDGRYGFFDREANALTGLLLEDEKAVEKLIKALQEEKPQALRSSVNIDDFRKHFMILIDARIGFHREEILKITIDAWDDAWTEYTKGSPDA